MPETASTIANIVEGQNDAAGVRIDRVYSRINGAYAIYRTAQGVIVQFADDPTLGGQQRQALAPLNPLRGDINGLIDGWRSDKDPVKQGRGARFDRLVAASLGMALQGDVASAQAGLAAVKAEIVDLRTSVARTRYVIVAGATTFVLVLIFTAMMTSWFARFHDYDPHTDPFWAAAAIGSIGAWFSIALAIRGRTIHTDLQSRDNDIDAILRVMIGAISAAVLLALLNLGLVNFMINGQSVTGSDGLVVVAFAAGFSERLVSDFLSQSVANALRARGNAAVAAASGMAPPTAPPAPGADEMHPLGQAPPPSPPGPGGDANVHTQDDDQADGCGAAGLNVPAPDQTADTDLPATTGGVANP
jgi:hypothetical protein